MLKGMRFAKLSYSGFGPDARFELAATRSKGGRSTTELIGMSTKMHALVTGSVLSRRTSF